MATPRCTHSCQKGTAEPDGPKINRGFSYTAGLYFTRLIDTGETLRGGKLGVEYKIKLDGDFSMGLYARKNAFGDIDAMVVRNEPVYSFRLQGRAGF